jgi:hypothetical protein
MDKVVALMAWVRIVTMHDLQDVLSKADANFIHHLKTHSDATFKQSWGSITLSADSSLRCPDRKHLP